jgi:hypothetical protein
MRKLIQLLVVAIVGTTSDSFAQNGIYAGDALRFSRTDYGSSSRFKSMGNAQVSLGGDASSTGGNPAGLGMFTHSEFSITPEFNTIVTQADYLGKDTRTAVNHSNVSQSALIWYMPVNKIRRNNTNNGLINLTWGIGVNRNNDYNAEFNYGGINRNSSITNMYAEQSTYGYPESGLRTIPSYAHQNYLTRKIAGSETQYIPATTTTNNEQNKNEITGGSTSEVNFSGAMNISNKFYLGLNVGIVTLHYFSDALYNETGHIIDTKPGPYETNYRVGNAYDLTYLFYQATEGTGVNGRVGMIFKPFEALRIGAVFQTPTWLNMYDTYDEDFKLAFSERNTHNPYVGYAPAFRYKLRTPYKGSLGASIILGKSALLTADIDYVDYSSIRLSAEEREAGYYDSTTAKYVTDYDYLNSVNGTNTDVKQFYTAAVNYRIGGEYRINNFSLRAGYGVNGSPYKNDTDGVFAIRYYSGGMGYRFGSFSADLAYQRTETTNTSSPYQLTDSSEPIATVKLTRSNVFLTLGVRF